MQILKPMVLAALISVPGAASAASAVVFADDGTYGFSTNAHSLTQALQVAMGYCAVRSSDCSRSDITSKQGYSAIAVGTEGFGYALAESSPEAARAKAESMCKKRGKDCVLATLWREELPVVQQEEAASSAPSP